MDEEPLNPDQEESSNEQEALPAQASVLMYESPPPPKKPDHTPEMLQGIKLTLWWYFGAFCIFELLVIVAAIATSTAMDNVLLTIAGYIYFSVIYLIFIWGLISLILLIISLFKRKFYRALGILLVTGGSILLSGAFCIGAPLVYFSISAR